MNPYICGACSELRARNLFGRCSKSLEIPSPRSAQLRFGSQLVDSFGQQPIDWRFDADFAPLAHDCTIIPAYFAPTLTCLQV